MIAKGLSCRKDRSFLTAINVIREFNTKVILPNNSFQTVVNISEISLKLVLNVIPNSTQNISVISFQTVLNVIGKTHSRQYLILPENWFQTVLNVIR